MHLLRSTYLFIRLLSCLHPPATPLPHYLDLLLRLRRTFARAGAYRYTAPSMPPPTTIPDRVVRELELESDVRLSGRTRGKTCNRMAQKEAHRIGLSARITPGAYTSQLATQNSINEALHEHCSTPRPLDLPAAYASDLPTAVTVKEADESITPISGGTIGYVSLVVFCRLILLSRPSNQLAILLKPNGCSV